MYPLPASVAARGGFVINVAQIEHHHFVECEGVLVGDFSEAKGRAYGVFAREHPVGPAFCF